MDPLLGHLAVDLFLPVQGKQHLVNAFHHLHVLVLCDDIAGAVGAWLGSQQLPVFRTNALELRVHKHSPFVGFAHHLVHLESYNRKKVSKVR